VSVGPEVFGEDYLHFYELRLTDEVSDRQADLLWGLLDLRPDARVLDVACGHGRIANRLAARGARVTGLDADAFFLDRAREDAAARGVDVEYVQGDMRRLPWEARFDAVLLWFTAFGYFDDEGNSTVVRMLWRALREGACALIDVNHLPWILAHLQRQAFMRRDADVLLDDFVWHPDTSVMETQRVVVRDGAVRETPYSIRMFMPVELCDLLVGAGFARVELLGPEGDPLTPDDRRVIALAHA
jgi:SAM-dependent methyltransferase